MRHTQVKIVVKCDDGEGCADGTGRAFAGFDGADMGAVTEKLVARGWTTSNARDVCPRCVRRAAEARL